MSVTMQGAQITPGQDFHPNCDKVTHDTKYGLLFCFVAPLPENTLELFGLIPCPALIDPVYTTAAGELRIVNKNKKI